MAKESRLGIRINSVLSNKIDRYIGEGRFASRTDFGTKAIKELIRQMEREDNDITTLFNVVSHLIIHTRMPVHTIPSDLEKEFKQIMADRRGW